MLRIAVSNRPNWVCFLSRFLTDNRNTSVFRNIVLTSCGQSPKAKYSQRCKLVSLLVLIDAVYARSVTT